MVYCFLEEKSKRCGWRKRADHSSNITQREPGGVTWQRGNAMRRPERETKNRDELIQILTQCKVCRLGMVDDWTPYVVPVNFGYQFAGDTLHLYFHCAHEGRKIDILRQNPEVCFEMDCGHELLEGEIACGYSFGYASIIGNGRAKFLTGLDQKMMALERIMEHQTGKSGFVFENAMARAVTVVQITSEEYCGKSNHFFSEK